MKYSEQWFKEKIDRREKRKKFWSKVPGVLGDALGYIVGGALITGLALAVVTAIIGGCMYAHDMKPGASPKELDARIAKQGASINELQNSSAIHKFCVDSVIRQADLQEARINSLQEEVGKLRSDLAKHIEGNFKAPMITNDNSFIWHSSMSVTNFIPRSWTVITNGIR